jgi:tRNA (cytidine/uridine-2'-O-)-methyltransferase
VHLVLVHPEIPHNAGCIARLCAATGNVLHMVEPLGFSLEDRYLKRAGLDYWPQVELCVHSDWNGLARALGGATRRPLDQRVRLFTARGGTSLFATAFDPEDVLVFGCESKGLPSELLERHADRRVYVPVARGVRSLNLANVACLAVYTAMVRAGVPLPDNDGTYAAHPLANEDIWPLSRAARRCGRLTRRGLSERRT